MTYTKHINKGKTTTMNAGLVTSLLPLYLLMIFQFISIISYFSANDTQFFKPKINKVSFTSLFPLFTTANPSSKYIKYIQCSLSLLIPF